MGFIQGFKNLFVGEDEVDQIEYQPGYAGYENSYDNRKEAINETEKSSFEDVRGGVRRMNIEQTQTLQLVLARPENFDEVKSIGEDVNALKTVILNLEMVKSEDAKRILDFLSGVAFANNASIEMMAQKTFGIVPAKVDYDNKGIDLLKELENNGYGF